MSSIPMSYNAPAENFLVDFFVKIYRYREYLKQSILRDLRTKYKRSVLGYLWTMLHPLGMMAVLSVVFSHVMKIAIEDYPVFLFAGMLPWNYFQSTSMMSLGSIRANARLFGQVPVPKYIFIVSVSLSNLVNYMLAVIPLIVLMFIFGRPISPTILFFPLVLFPLFCVTVGLSLILATCNVFFDDTLHLSEVALQALYFMSPVLYSREMLPARLLDWLILNPVFCQIEFIRGIFYNGALPNLETYAMNCIASIIFLSFGLWIFNRAEDKFLYFV